MKRRPVVIFVLLGLLAVCIGISFLQVPRQVSQLLYLVSLGVAVFALVVSLGLALVVEPLRDFMRAARIVVAAILVVVGPFTFHIWSDYQWWTPFWVLFAGLLLIRPKSRWWNIPNALLTTAAFAFSFFPPFHWLPMLIMAANALFYLCLPSYFSIRYYAFFIAAYAGIYSITDLPDLSGARLGLFVPMLVLSWGCLEPQIVRLWQNRVENNAIMQSELTIAHIEEKALKAEIRPHFLLNALNNVRVAYHEDTAEGKRLLDELIGLETLIAEASKSDFIPIDQEVEIIRGLIKLFSLERKRDIRFVVDIKDHDLMIPPMLLEPLVENSLQHSGIMNQDDGEVLIQEYEDFGFAIIIVADNGQGQPLPSQSRGIGLSNVIKRIELLNEGHMNISSDDQGTSIEIRFRLENE